MASADSLSPFLGLLLMGDGQHFNTWGALTNTNLATIDNAIAGNSVIDVSGGNITLTPAQTAAAILTFTGPLLTNTAITFPQVSGRWVISNRTTGSFTLTVQAGQLGTPFTIPGSATQNHIYYTDGQSFFDASQSTVAVAAMISAALQILIPPGMMAEFGNPVAPSGWYECNGNPVSRTTDAPLYAAIGTAWGNGDGVTTFNLPDRRGVFSRGWDHGRGIDVGRLFASSQSDSFASHTHIQTPHTHTVTDPGHVHGIGPSGVPLNVTTGSIPANQPGGGVTNSATTGISIANATAVNQVTGGTETTVKNIATLICIKR